MPPARPSSSRPQVGTSGRGRAPRGAWAGLRRAWQALLRCLRPRALGADARTAPRRAALPPMPRGQASAARRDLTAFLDRVPGARRVWPSLALLERVLESGRADGVHRVEACVLRHAARSLDGAGDDLGPGLVVLRRRIELVLRRKHGDPPTHWRQAPPHPGADAARRFQDSLTEFIDVDRFGQVPSRLP